MTSKALNDLVQAFSPNPSKAPLLTLLQLFPQVIHQEGEETTSVLFIFVFSLPSRVPEHLIDNRKIVADLVDE